MTKIVYKEPDVPVSYEQSRTRRDVDVQRIRIRTKRDWEKNGKKPIDGSQTSEKIEVASQGGRARESFLRVASHGPIDSESLRAGEYLQFRGREAGEHWDQKEQAEFLRHKNEK